MANIPKATEESAANTELQILGRCQLQPLLKMQNVPPTEFGPKVHIYTVLFWTLNLVSWGHVDPVSTSGQSWTAALPASAWNKASMAQPAGVASADP